MPLGMILPINLPTLNTRQRGMSGYYSKVASFHHVCSYDMWRARHQIINKSKQMPDVFTIN